ncbi:MAG TPA: hypothetical protein ENH33_06355 [Actinobacteria bacterium]|nr:hypothetical protein [Actinomycetota bacterium]
MMKNLRDEHGVAAVETALILSLLLMLALGSVEWGLGLRDWLSVTAATREGARVGAAAGDESGADCVILEAAAGAVRDINGAIVEAWIYQSDPSGTIGPKQRYRPFVTGDTLLTCNSSTWGVRESGWPASVRDNDGSTRDWLGVRIVFDHDWLTGFAWFTGSVCNRDPVNNTCWAADTVMRIEPDPTP